jgi:hypothetical protein
MTPSAATWNRQTAPNRRILREKPIVAIAQNSHRA